MQNRENVLNEILQLKCKQLLLELPTGYGKSKIALTILKDRLEQKNSYLNKKILIVIPKNCLINNWNDEIKKWLPIQYETLIKNHITYTTYVSLPKYAGYWDMVIFDEGHHLTERCIEALQSFTIDNILFLSATVKRNMKWNLRKLYPKIYIYKIRTREAIDNEVLPDPHVILIPLKLDDINNTEIKTIRKTKKQYPCTPREYYDDISRLIEWWKGKAMYGNQAFKNIWLHHAGERIKWLSKQKTTIVSEILKKLSNYRTLTFCSSIEQAEHLGKNSIHSKKKESQEILEKFNKGKIKHITSVQVLDEGVNLTNCQIGIYANLNSSERIVKQRLGRILRHKNPVIIIPFYLNTRDEEIVKQMIQDYNPNLIKVVYTIKNIVI